MKEILTSKTWSRHIDTCCEIDFDDRNEGDYSTGHLNIYAPHSLDKFLLEVFLDCEGQCKREGYSFFLFDNFQEIKNFMENDDDMFYFRFSCNNEIKCFYKMYEDTMYRKFLNCIRKGLINLMDKGLLNYYLCCDNDIITQDGNVHHIRIISRDFDRDLVSFKDSNSSDSFHMKDIKKESLESLLIDLKNKKL